MTTVTVGHNIGLSIAFLDQNGNPMLVPVTTDTPPTWSNTNPEVETLKPAADGLTCEADTLTAGNDVVSLSVVVGGVAYPASLAVEVDAAPQVLTSVAINAEAI